MNKDVKKREILSKLQAGEYSVQQATELLDELSIESRPWSRGDDLMVRKFPPEQAAKIAGRSLSAVVARRQHLGLPNQNVETSQRTYSSDSPNERAITQLLRQLESLVEHVEAVELRAEGSRPKLNGRAFRHHKLSADSEAVVLKLKDNTRLLFGRIDRDVYVKVTLRLVPRRDSDC